MIFFRILLALTVTTLLPACEQSATPPAEEYQYTSLNFGTQISITIYDVPAPLAQQAFADLERDFSYWQSVWNPWVEGPLARVNQLLTTKAAFNLPLHLIPLITKSQQLFTQSEGLFNPAIGKLINLWKFHEHELPDKKPPEDSQIRQLVSQNPRMDDLEIDGIRIKSNNENTQLNFGAVAKGYALDLSMKTLQNMGIKNAVLNAGGDLKVIGMHHDRPWRVGIKHPRSKSVIASVDVSNGESVFTSGDYERYFDYNGKRYHHILDPRTGYSADLTQSVTVIHDDAATADAAATALFIAGPENWYRIAKKMGIKYVMLIAANGDIYMNPMMAKRIRLISSAKPVVNISPAL